MRYWMNILLVAGMVLSLFGAVPVSAQSFDCSSVTDVQQEECEALVALFTSTNGAGWTNKTNWLQTTTVGDWYGVNVEIGHVKFINLNNNNMVGSIPPDLGDLTHLQGVDLGANQLSGSIPPELGELNNLDNLYLNNNHLIGNIPPQLGELTNLETLDLSQNQLSGSIPPSLGNLSQLKLLALFDNQLSGSIPTELGNLDLHELSLSGNELSGNIPTELGSLSNLEYLYLENNQLSGDVPASLTNLTNLAELDLDYNHLTVPSDYPNPSNPLHVFLNHKDPNWHLRQTPLIKVYLPLVRR